MTNTFDRLETARVALKVALGLAAFLAGLDKFTGLLANWQAYLAPAVAAALPVSPATFMGIVGIVEMAVGAALLGRWTRIGAPVAAAWLLAIAANLLLTGQYFDVAVRDVVMALGAFALWRLTEAHEAATPGELAEPGRSGRISAAA